jgi:serine/threonine-protein phosphatase 2B catalytic subunit
VFGIDAVTTFLKKNNLTAIIRAHEAQFDGYKMQMINEQTQIPRVITIFSAPNYCDVYKNKGACLKFDDELLNIRQFVSSPHPYYLPNFMDVFTWSLPFVAEKVTDMLYSILSFEADREDHSAAATVKISGPSEVLRNKGGVLKDKVIAVTKLIRMHKLLQENKEQIHRLKKLTPGGKLPQGVLQGGAAAIDQAIASFKDAKIADAVNESVPGQGTTPSPCQVQAQAKAKERNSRKAQIHFKADMSTDSDSQSAATANSYANANANANTNANTNANANANANTNSNTGQTKKRRKMTITKDLAQ